MIELFALVKKNKLCAPPKINAHQVDEPDLMGAAAYQLGNTSYRTITEVKQL